LEDYAITALYDLAKGAGLELSGKQLSSFNAFGDFLLEANRRVNLTAVREGYFVAIKHFFDSLTPAIYVRELASLLSGGGTASLVDVGAGAGFPGIPLKILYGDALNVALIDATRKKVNFMNDAVGMLGLNGIVAIHARAEDAAKLPGMGGKFDFATARALALLPKTAAWCLPFLKPGGILIAMKGLRENAEAELELAAPKLPRLGGGKPRIEEFRFGDETYERTLVVIEKIALPS